MALDERDQAILRELQQDARKTNREVAAAVGISATTCLDRVRSLQKRGIIVGASLDVNLSQIGRPVQALISIRIRPPSRENIEAFRNWVSELPETIGVFVVSGNVDFLLHVAVPDNTSLYAFVIDRLTERPEVSDVNTSIIYEHICSQVIEPMQAPRR
jgi:DNA-binding Lrp family transcriptional regulator